MPTGARTITRVRTEQRDKLDPTPVGPAAELTIIGVIILPRQTYEAGRGWITVDGWDVYILPSSRVMPEGRAYADGDIVHTDELLVDGETWAVDGRPAPYDKGAVRKATLIRLKQAD